MKESIKNMKPIVEQPKEKLIYELEKIIHMTEKTKSLVLNTAPCDEVFRQFAEIKDATFDVDSLLLSYQLENCLIPRLRHFHELVHALNRLIKKKHGALITIQRNDDLSPFIGTGTTIDGLISRPLIECIFYPDNPLHDGAMIINEERIVAAGCVLPLSQQTHSEDGQPMGMRHRAALGITEQTDALVIIVSEETQRVSLALGGHLYRLKKTADLWEEIYESVVNPPNNL